MIYSKYKNASLSIFLYAPAIIWLLSWKCKSWPIFPCWNTPFPALRCVITWFFFWLCVSLFFSLCPLDVIVPQHLMLNCLIFPEWSDQSHNPVITCRKENFHLNLKSRPFPLWNPRLTQLLNLGVSDLKYPKVKSWLFPLFLFIKNKRKQNTGTHTKTTLPPNPKKQLAPPNCSCFSEW